jgi:hypothetical protein
MAEFSPTRLGHFVPEGETSVLIKWVIIVMYIITSTEDEYASFAFNLEEKIGSTNFSINF